MADQTIIGGGNICHCCEGIGQETPQATANRPGLGAIAYRIGTHEQFLATLLARLHSSRQAALRGLRTRDTGDFSIALLDAFSSMADVLTFYTERIANEAYLRTATERRSVLELAALIGYQLRPGVAASTWLAFTIEDAPGAFAAALVAGPIAQVVPETPPTVTVEIGTKVQSVPGPGEQPQVFETIEKITARGEWNAIQPRLTQPQAIGSSTDTYILSGAVTTLNPGDRLLALDAAGNGYVRTVSSTVVAADSKTTTVQLDSGSGGPIAAPAPSPLPTGSISDFPPSIPLTAAVAKEVAKKKWDGATLAALAAMQKWPLDQLAAEINLLASQASPATGQLFVFRQRAAVFGYNAPVWDSLPPNLRYDVFFTIVDPSDNTKSKVVTVTAPFKTSWENLTLEARAEASSGVRSVYLDNTYPGVLPGSWVALQTTSPAAATAIAAVTANTEVAHSDFSVSNKVSRLRIQQASALSAFPIRTTSVLCQSEPLSPAPVPITDTVDGKSIVLDRAYLSLTAGQTVVISGERSDLDGVTAAEIRVLDAVALDGSLTVIALDSSLANSYKRATVRINANTALATNGETVQEVLGSGDGSVAFQSFALKQPPLTFTAASTPEGTKSTLEIRVDGVLWKEVPFFFSHGPEEHIYITRRNDDGVTTVTFGDGRTGARLPTGQQNVTAKYRKGIGKGGLVRANQLSQMSLRPLGVRGANNPLPATGAADPEKLEDARRNATLTIRALDRIVSLEDYEDFARAYAGIGKALATWTWSGEQRIVLLTVAGADGAVVPDESKLHDDLLDSIARFSEPNVALRLFSYDPIFFRVAGKVAAESDRLKEDVQAAVETALRTAFSFDTRAFGQPVHRSDVIAAIQGVTGVVNVDLTAFCRSDQSALTLEDDIPAAVPQPGKDAIFAAQLLTLDARPLDLEFTQ